jgi:hemolysin activation/secretion protein
MKAKYTGCGLATQAMLVALVASAAPLMAQAQTAGVTAATTAATPSADAFEQRRAQERQNQLRQQQEQTPDVRLQAAPSPSLRRLHEGELPCSRISSVALEGEDAARFAWLLDAITASNTDDSPLRKCLGARGIEQVRQRAQDALNTRGFVTSRVLLQSQALDSGTLVLTVLPGRIHAIRLAEPDSHRGTLWNAVPARVGDVLDLRDIEQTLENFRRVPGVHADIAISPAEGAAPGESDLVISYQQGLPFRLSVSADDSGTRATGKYQGAVTFSHDNWWTLNDLFYLSLNHDLGNRPGGGGATSQGTAGGTLHYSLPLGYWLLGTTISRNHYHQTVAGATQNYLYSGTSRNAEAQLSRVIYRGTSGKTTLGLKAFQRASSNFIDDTEIAVQRRVVGGWELDLSHREVLGHTTLEGKLAYRRGTGAFGSLPSPEEAFGEGTSRFALLAADASATVPFELGGQRLRYSANWRMQSQRTPLTPQDRFAIGGRYTVRAFDGESSLAGDSGWLLRNELAATLGNSEGAGSSTQELYAGLDHGEVGGPSAQLLAGRRLTGIVFGLRGGVGKLQYDLFVGAPLAKPQRLQTAPVTGGFNLNFTF